MSDVNWGALGRFALKLGTGDVVGAASELATPQPGTTSAPPEPEPKEGDPACKRTCDGAKCMGHGFGGMCIYPAGKAP